MGYIVKDKTNFLKFDRFVRDITPITTVEPVGSPIAASEFSNEDIARDMVKEAEKSGYDTTEFTYHDLEQVLETEKKVKENEAEEFLKEGWKNTSFEGRREKLTQMKEDKRAEWLQRMGDTSGVTPYSEQEQKDQIKKDAQNKLGIALSDEQVEQMWNKMNKQEA